MTAEVGEVKLIDFKLFDRVKTIGECNGFFEIGAEGEITQLPEDGNICYLVKFDKGVYQKLGNNSWYALEENLELIQDTESASIPS